MTISDALKKINNLYRVESVMILNCDELFYRVELLIDGQWRTTNFHIDNEREAHYAAWQHIWVNYEGVEKDAAHHAMFHYEQHPLWNSFVEKYIYLIH